MTNPYFNHVANRIDPGSRALDSQINNIADEIALGFDRLPTEAELFGGTAGFATSTGTANALLVTLGYTVSLTDGYNFYVRFTATNVGGGTTINVNATGVKTIVNSDGSGLNSGSLINGTIGHLVYDITFDRYILISNNSAWGKPGATTVQNPSEYCPGYTFTFVSTQVWRITGIDVTALFSVTRRLKFVDGANEYFGTITVSVFSAGNTDMTMSMEGGDVLTNTIGAVCLTTGTAAWSVIATDPFLGTGINDIVMGDIGPTTYAFAVGQLGKAGVSTDGGLTWVMLSTGTTEHLNACCYDSINEQFWAGGRAGVLIDTVDGSSVTLDTTSIPAIATTGSADIYGITFIQAGLVLLFEVANTPTNFSADSVDQGTTWTARASLGLAQTDFPNMQALGGPSNNFITGPIIHGIISGNTGTRIISGISDTSWATGSSLTPNVCSCIQGFTDEGSLLREMLGGSDGTIKGNGDWSGRSNAGILTTFKIRGFAYSPLHDRMIVVGDNAVLGFLDGVNAGDANAWTAVQNGFNPTAEINSIVWDDTHGIYIAVGSTGQIARSTNGTN